MQVVSSTEFATHQDKYFNMAIDHDICIEKGEQRFHLSYAPRVEEQPFLEPDEDFYRAITAEELKKRMHVSIRKFFTDKA